MINIKETIIQNQILLGENRKSLLDNNHFDFSIGIDENFIMGGGVLCTSICENNKEMNINFHIFTSSSLKNDIEKLELLTKKYKNLIIMLHFINDKPLKKLPTEFIWTTAIYFRFLIPETLYKLGIMECWYLDSDELCVNKIPKMPKSNHPISALVSKKTNEERYSFLYNLTKNKNIWDISSAGIYIYI